MPRRTPNKHKLSDLYIKKLKPQATAVLVWDTLQRNFALRVETSGHKSFKLIYTRHNRTRWYNIGAFGAIGLADARKLASKLMLSVMEGGDPQATRRAERGAGTFQELAERYREYAKRRNRSWKQADALVDRHLLPRWAALRAASISRSDVKAVLAKIESPTVANQVLASASALFSWALREEFGGVTANPCSKIERNVSRSRERVLSAAELPLFWAAFDSAGLVAGTALKCLLLLGQRPGEIAHMRREHVEAGWWTMPGAPVPAQGWPGTKNAATHRVWLPAPVQALLAELDDEPAATGYVFTTSRGHPIGDLDGAMRRICAELNVERATPHDLRRTFSSKVTELGFGREAMNRLTNHKEGGIASVYDRFQYAAENKRIMEAVAAHILALATGGSGNLTALPSSSGTALAPSANHPI